MQEFGRKAAVDFYKLKDADTYSDADIELLGAFITRLMIDTFDGVEESITKETGPMLRDTPDPLKTLLQQYQDTIFKAMRQIKINS